MHEYKEKRNTILDSSIMIAFYIVFWITVTVFLPIISFGLRLYSKEPKILNDKPHDRLQDS